MMETYLVAEADSVRVRSGASATANIWVVVGGQGFPSQGWNDFATIILGWWASAFLRLLRSATSQEIVDFMDGPYAVEVAKGPNGVLHFRTLEGPQRKIVRATGEAIASAFVEGVFLQSQAILSACREQGRWSTDEETLQNLLVTLEKELAANSS